MLSVVKNGTTKSCGCLQREQTSKANIVDLDLLKSKKYGRLTVLRDAGTYRQPNGIPLRRVECLCDCGKITTVIRGSLVSGGTKSCGCLNLESITTHGLSQTYPGKNWYSMIDRCYNPKNTRHKQYGGRGITVCDEWHDIVAFVRWANENGCKRGLEIDRRNNDGNYEPGNCRYVTKKENNRNRKGVKLSMDIAQEIRNAYLLLKGLVTQQEIADAYGVSRKTIGRAINNRAWV